MSLSDHATCAITARVAVVEWHRCSVSDDGETMFIDKQIDMDSGKPTFHCLTHNTSIEVDDDLIEWRV